MDGTLMCETYFIYYDTMMFIDYCDNYLADNQFLTEEEKAELWRAASVIKPNYKAQRDLAENFAKAYSGMTVQELYDYAAEFGRKTTVSFLDSRNVDGYMQYKDGFYLPMVEVVKYLYDNGFTIYVVSGTERTTTRAIVDNSPISDYVTPNHVIGTEFEVKLEGHENDHWNDDYKYGENGKDDKLVITGFIQKNLNANKTIYIDREIGQRPVLAFGNSGSDTSMLNYALINNKYPSEAYMLIADDTVREWGSENAWEDNADKYRAMGYTPVSMKNEFLQIYPEEFISRSDIQYIPKNNDAAQQDNALQDVA
jgi:phosphoserine phosphatase